MSTRQLLLDSTERIARHGPTVSDPTMTPFADFRTAVMWASGGRHGSPQELLGDLEPKDIVLRFLSNLHATSKPRRRQVEVVFAQLLDVPSWVSACVSDATLCEGLPLELRVALDEAKALPPQMVESAPDKPERDSAVETKNTSTKAVHATAPVADDSAEAGALNLHGYPNTQHERAPRDSEIPRVVDAAWKEQPKKPSADAVERQSSGEIALRLLDVACQKMEEINYSFVDRDTASDAFESFRIAVRRVVMSRTTDDDEKLCEREPKDLILRFLLDVHSKRANLRNRAKSLFVHLWAFDAWRDAISAEASIYIVVQELLADEVYSIATDSELQKITSNVSLASLAESFASADSRGGIGALIVHAISAHNLINVDPTGLPDPFVRITLHDNQRSWAQTTETVTDSLNPQWKTPPLKFEVPSLDSWIKFEVLHSNHKMEDVSLGTVELKYSDLPPNIRQERVMPPQRFQLKDVKHGELEIAMAYELSENASDTSERLLESDDGPGTWKKWSGRTRGTESYQIGDIARGVLTQAARDKDKGYKFGDITRGVIARAARGRNRGRQPDDRTETTHTTRDPPNCAHQ